MRSTRRVNLASWLVLTLAAVVPPAAQAGQPAGSKVPKIAVLEVKAVGAFDPKTVSGLSSLIATEATRFPVKVVSGSDLTSLMGFDKQRQLLGCAESSCLAEIGGALGVDYLLTTEVAQVGEVWLMTLALLDVSKAQGVKRLTKKAKNATGLVDLASSSLPELLAGLGQPGKPVAEVRPPDEVKPRREKPEPVQEPEPEPEVTAAAGEGSGSTQRTIGYALGAAGAAALVGGGVFGGLALGSFNDAKTAKAADFEALKQTTKDRMLLADVLYAAGAVTLGVGAALIFTAPSGESVAATVAPAPGGATLVVAGGF